MVDPRIDGEKVGGCPKERRIIGANSFLKQLVIYLIYLKALDDY